MPRRNSIVYRWLVNSLSIIILLLVALSVVLSFSVRTYYHRAVENALSSRIDSFESYFQMKASQHDSLSISQIERQLNFDSLAKEFVENFVEKERFELQVLDTKGVIVFSSTGFAQSEEPLADYEKAYKNESYRYLTAAKSSSGEKIMSATLTLKNISGSTFGGIRMITSLEGVNRQVFVFVLLIIIVAICVLLFIIISSSYFISSIVKPVTDINKAARKIALGDYTSLIEKTSDDEIGELVDTVNYMAEEIADAEKMKNDFISSVSHELRTPLTAIKGWSETLQQVGSEDQEVTQKGLEVISSEVQRLSGIVEELLDFSRINSGHLAMKFERMDILAELTEAAYLYEDRAKREGIELVFIEPDMLPPVLGDKDRLKQVFINIIDNAIKYSSSGGKVRIETAMMGSAIQIVVSDIGTGIPKDELNKVKKKFYRANRTRPGSGIGLALADEIVRRHKGRLDIDSEEEEGTTVSIMIPIAPAED